MNYIVDPGREYGIGWVEFGAAERTNAYGSHGGSYAERLFARKSALGGDQFSQFEQTGIEFPAPQTGIFSAWLNADGAIQAIPLVTTIDRGLGFGAPQASGTLLKSNLAAGWNKRFFQIFGPIHLAPFGIRFRVNTPGIDGQEGYWLVDDVRLGSRGSVAIELAERGIDAMIATLQANLAAELAQIQTEQADGIVLAVPANADYFAFPRKDLGGSIVSDCQIEVFESAFDVQNPYTDLSANRALFDMPVTVRVTCFNRNLDTQDVLAKRMRRYGAAIVRVLLERYTLGGADPAIHYAVANGYRPQWFFEGEASEKVTKVQVEIPATVRCEEINA